MIFYSKEHKTWIDWESTGEIVDELSIHVKEEVGEGEDEEGNKYSCTLIVDDGEIVDIYEIIKE